MAVFQGNALDALRQALTKGDTVDPALGISITGSVSLGDPGVATTSLGKAEDAPSASGDVGVAILGRRADTFPTTTDTDGDYINLALTSRGGVILGSTVSTGTLARAEDAAHATADAGIQSLGVRADTDAVATSATGDYGFLALDSMNRQKVQAYASTADPVDAAGAAVTIKHVAVAATADGDNTVIAAVASKRIRIIGYTLSATLTGTVTFKSATTSLGSISAVTGTPFTFGGGGLHNPAFTGATNENFIISNSAGTDTLGHITYVEIT